MYFHTEKEGIFFMDHGRFEKTYPFTINSDSGAIKRLIENSLQLDSNVLSSIKFNNVFFNFGEKDKVSEDRMLILLQLPISSEMIEGDKNIKQQDSYSRQNENESQKIVSPF